MQRPRMVAVALHDALRLKPRAEKGQSPLRGLGNVRVVSEGDFATSQPVAYED